MVSVGTLAAGVAHEINNPLAYVMANLEMIAEEIRAIAGGSPADRLRDLADMTDEARQGAERVRKIVRGLKTLSRADDEQRRPLDVRRVIEVAVNMAFNEIRHRARLVKDFGEAPLVMADEARLGQVVINLLVNAAQAIPEGDVEHNEIRIVTTTAAGGEAVVEVRDTGPGIAPEVMPRLFDPFFTTKAIGVGSGLGLSICHGIVAAVGGRIEVESEAGRGSRFRVVLPAAPADSVPRPPRRLSSRRPPPRRARVLVVDDDPMIRSSLRRILREHEVTLAESGRAALGVLRADASFDVVLCDLMMPEGTGMDLYRELSESMPDLVERMVFITGGAFTPAARAFLDEVPNHRFEKPFDAQNLRALVDGFVRIRASSQPP